MTTEYQIHVINNGTATQDFWCFLSQPEMNVGSTVYANSAANLNIVPNSPSNNSFTIPLQYSIGAGASNQAVALDVVVDSDITENIELGEAWNASYAATPPPQGPTLSLASQGGPGTSVSITSNHFNAGLNNQNHWYESQSFGVESAQGFMGVTWVPNPGDIITITPTVSFYVATGTYSTNALAEMTTVSSDCATISTSDFSPSTRLCPRWCRVSGRRSGGRCSLSGLRRCGLDYSSASCTASQELRLHDAGMLQSIATGWSPKRCCRRPALKAPRKRRSHHRCAAVRFRLLDIRARARGRVAPGRAGRSAMDAWRGGRAIRNAVGYASGSRPTVALLLAFSSFS